MRHIERHRTQHIGWLRASVLGANDGIVSTASLIVGIAAAHASHGSILVTGVAGLVAGAMSMAAGEYVSVHSQADTEQADLARETAELRVDPDAEHEELVQIYVRRGLDAQTARSVATQLMVASTKAAVRSAPSGNKLQASVAQAAMISSVAMPAAATCRRCSRSVRRQVSLVSV